MGQNKGKLGSVLNGRKIKMQHLKVIGVGLVELTCFYY